ncbi:MAG: NAD(P)/FAD-dependent oxidoreductase [Rhodocyclaceae bacterium]|nr:NAD(P)/FAD-dependent oxidoreductase [Rhodocyclaceae bacterium]
MSRPHVIIIGAGFTGLSAALALTRKGFRVTVLEEDPLVGGLAGAFETAGGTRLDRFYHHWFTSDTHVMDLVRDLGLEGRVTTRPTSTGVWYQRSMFRLSSPLDLLRFRALPLRDRIRLGLLYLRARRLRDWRALEGLTAAEWLRRLGGENVWQVVWQPLLHGKFGPYADDVSAVWMWNKLKLRGGSRGRGGQERLAYLSGSFALLAEGMAHEITAAGGEIRTGHRVTSLHRATDDSWSATGNRGSVAGEAVIATTAPAVLADMLDAGGQASPAEISDLRRIPYLANLCLVLELDRRLGSTYWLNVNDPDFPFVGVIEHTNFEAPENYGGHHIVYLSRYLPHTDPMWQQSDAEIAAFALPYLARMFPSFRPDRVLRHHVWRARWAQPVVGRHYSRLIPDAEGPLPGLFPASMAQIYPEDRGTNHAVREGLRVAERVASRFGGKGDGA